MLIASGSAVRPCRSISRQREVIQSGYSLKIGSGTCGQEVEEVWRRRSERTESSQGCEWW